MDKRAPFLRLAIKASSIGHLVVELENVTKANKWEQLRRAKSYLKSCSVEDFSPNFPACNTLGQRFCLKFTVPVMLS